MSKVFVKCDNEGVLGRRRQMTYTAWGLRGNQPHLNGSKHDITPSSPASWHLHLAMYQMMSPPCRRKPPPGLSSVMLDQRPVVPFQVLRNSHRPTDCQRPPTKPRYRSFPMKTDHGKMERLMSGMILVQETAGGKRTRSKLDLGRERRCRKRRSPRELPRWKCSRTR